MPQRCTRRRNLRTRTGAGRTPGSQSWGFLTGSSDVGRKYRGQRISMDFKDADLTNVFRIIAEVSNLNIITSDEVKGKVSLRLVNVPGIRRSTSSCARSRSEPPRRGTSSASRRFPPRKEEQDRRRAEAGRAVPSGGAEPGRRGQGDAGGGLRHHPGQLQQGFGTADQIKPLTSKLGNLTATTGRTC